MDNFVNLFNVSDSNALTDSKHVCCIHTVCVCFSNCHRFHSAVTGWRMNAFNVFYTFELCSVMGLLHQTYNNFGTINKTGLFIQIVDQCIIIVVHTLNTANETTNTSFYLLSNFFLLIFIEFLFFISFKV